MTEEPTGELQIRTLCMPKDTNASGDIFGGWLLSQMDLAGALAARNVAKGRTATIAINAMEFHKPVFVGDALCCYTNIEKIGNTSIRIKVEAWALRGAVEERVKVTEGTFTFVAIGDDRKPRAIEK